MTPPIGENWALETCGGVLSTLAAAARAVASRGPDPVISDPFAEVLVRAVEREPLTQLADGTTEFSDFGAGWIPLYFGILSRAFDEFAEGACRVGIRQVVLLNPGLDCRAHRLDWPATTAIYEIDQRAVIDWKQRVLSSISSAPLKAQHRYVRIDRGQHWPALLLQAGFAETEPTLWIAEGFFVGRLPAAVQAETLNAITGLSARASRIAADYVDTRAPLTSKTMNEFLDRSRTYGPPGTLHDATFAKLREDLALSLDQRRWITYTADLDELFRDIDRPVPSTGEFPEAAKFIRLLSGVRA